MKYLKFFDTQAQQKTFLESEDYEWPHVSTTLFNNLRYDRLSKKEQILLQQPFTVEVLEAGAIRIYPAGLDGKLGYNINDESYGHEITIDVENNEEYKDVQVSVGDIVKLKGRNYGSGRILLDFSCNVSGNMMSFLDDSNYSTLTSLPDSNVEFQNFFSNSKIVSAKNLIIPALKNDFNMMCERMFSNCTNLIYGPNVYRPGSRMFYNCPNLIYFQTDSNSDVSGTVFNYNNLSTYGLLVNKRSNVKKLNYAKNGLVSSEPLAITYNGEVNALNNTVTVDIRNFTDGSGKLTNLPNGVTSNVYTGGEGRSLATLSISTNTTSSDRSATLYVTAPGVSKQPVVIQQEAPQIKLDKTSGSVKLSGGTITFTGINSYPSDGNIINDNAGITCTKTSSTQSDIEFTVTVQSYNTERTGTIYVTCENSSVPITISQIASSCSINLNNNAGGVDPNNTGPNGETIYRSLSNGHEEESSPAKMYITINGYMSFTLKVKTYGENNYDYMVVSELDKTPTRSGSTGGNTGNAGSGYNKSSATTWYDVVYNNIDGGEHVITIMYTKDDEDNEGDDRGYVYIPE